MKFGVAVKGGVLKGKQKTSGGVENEKQWKNGNHNKETTSVSRKNTEATVCPNHLKQATGSTRTSAF